jgi:hypothetical protein
VPAESSRLERRIGARDRWFLGLLACALLIVAVGAILLRGDDSGSRMGAGCVSTNRPGFTGAATYTYCGKDARAFCRRFTADDRDVAAQCQRLGIRLARRQRTGAVRRVRPA